MAFSILSTKCLIILIYLTVRTRGESDWIYSETDLLNWNQTCVERVNTTLFPKCRILFFNSVYTRINVICMDDNEFRVEPHAPQPHTLDYDFHKSSLDSTNTYALDSRPFLNVGIQCSAPFPLDFDFDGVGALTEANLDFSQEQYTENVTYCISILTRLTPEATGKYIFHSRKYPEIQTSLYLRAERGEKPFLIGGGTNTVAFKTFNATTTLLPCVSSELNVDVTLFRKVETKTWAKLNESDSLEYDRKRGFLMNSALQGDYRCLTGTDLPTTSTDYVEIKVHKTEEKKAVVRMAEDIRIEIKSNTSTVCYSTGNITLKFLNLRSRNPTENRLLVQCLQKKSEYCGKYTYHRRREGRRDFLPCPNNSTSCLWITNLHPSGILYCDGSIGDGAEEYSVSLNYFTGLDYKIYTNWRTAPHPAIIKPSWTPNATSIILRTGRPYKIQCDIVLPVLRTGTIELKAKHRNGTLELLPKEYKYGFGYYLTPDIEEFICSGTVWGTESDVESAIQINVDGAHHPRTGTHCESDRTMCKSGDDCILSYLKCDGFRHCRDGSDEDNCVVCRYGRLRCTNGTSLCMEMKCNNIPECSDGIDESTEWCQSAWCSWGQVKCKTGQCIHPSSLCDGSFDCLDKSDEDQDHCSKYYPSFYPIQTQVTFLPNAFNELVCKVNAMPVNFYLSDPSPYLKPRIDWWRRGQNISVSERVWEWDDRSGLKSSLRFENISEEDGGEYVCMATNRLKSVSQVYFVTVQGLMTTGPIENTLMVSKMNVSQDDSEMLLYSRGLSAWEIGGFLILASASALVLVIGAFLLKYCIRKSTFNTPVRIKTIKNEEPVLNGI